MKAPRFSVIVIAPQRLRKIKEEENVLTFNHFNCWGFALLAVKTNLTSRKSLHTLIEHAKFRPFRILNNK